MGVGLKSPKAGCSTYLLTHPQPKAKQPAMIHSKERPLWAQCTTQCSDCAAEQHWRRRNADWTGRLLQHAHMQICNARRVKPTDNDCPLYEAVLGKFAHVSPVIPGAAPHGSFARNSSAPC